MTKGEIRAKLAVDNRWLERGILALDARQTDDERQSRQTVYDNDRGWNAADASLGGYLANYIRRCRRPEGQRLTGEWVARARAMMYKYAGQLARIAAAKSAARQHADTALAVLDAA
jgi:hypothetical protein